MHIWLKPIQLCECVHPSNFCDLKYISMFFFFDSWTLFFLLVRVLRTRTWSPPGHLPQRNVRHSRYKHVLLRPSLSTTRQDNLYQTLAWRLAAGLCRIPREWPCPSRSSSMPATSWQSTWSVERSQTDRSKVNLIEREVNLIGSEFNPTRPAIRNESLKNASPVKGPQLRDKAIEVSRFLLVHRFHCVDVIYLPHHIPRHPCAIRPWPTTDFLESGTEKPLHPIGLSTIAFTARLLHIYQRYTLSFCSSCQNMAATRSRHEVYRRPSFLTDARRGRTASSFLTTRRGRTVSESLDVIKWYTTVCPQSYW